MFLTTVTRSVDSPVHPMIPASMRQKELANASPLHGLAGQVHCRRLLALRRVVDAVMLAGSPELKRHMAELEAEYFSDPQVCTRKTDTEFVTDAQLAKTRDEIAEGWAAEYAREDSPYYQDAMRAMLARGMK